MKLSQAQAFYGMRASATPTSTNVTNNVQIGVNQRTVPIIEADVAYTVGCVIQGSGSEFDLNLATASTSGTTAWTAGTAQVETATAAGTVTAAGNATVVVTAAGMTGSPKTISVPVANGDTADVWAGKVRTALAADTAVAERFTVSGTTTAIVLTRKPVNSYQNGDTIVPIYAANDSTLNVSLNNGTSTGITAATTSTNTTSGVATSGCNLFDGDAKDFEGTTIPTLGDIYGILIEVDSSSSAAAKVAGTNYGINSIPAGGAALITSGSSNQEIDTDAITITGSAFVKVTVIGAA
jgi:hypothetical protein